MKIAIMLLLLVACQAQGPLPDCTHPIQTRGAQVICVIDGDTVRLANGEKVRFIGIDTPEKDEEGFLDATQATVALLNGTHVILKKDVSEEDTFGRQLRYVYADAVFVNEALVMRGLARAREYPPDIAEAVTLRDAQNDAQERQVGLWAET